MRDNQNANVVNYLDSYLVNEELWVSYNHFNIIQLYSNILFYVMYTFVCLNFHISTSYFNRVWSALYSSHLFIVTHKMLSNLDSIVT